ncbi:hypothetical protein K6Y31_20340 [Motilimonas cestriensis]|uniref:Flagellar protein n=1 Tax=Motilimonas cestriensis TaxID=2742685 RepID=A0ABS8WDK2_9GAMM|nr:hypothetical protein [Motilimonas cestriensis]MCE2597127.1 hypothetical protein [Motilimonas cestriensis]
MSEFKQVEALSALPISYFLIIALLIFLFFIFYFKNKKSKKGGCIAISEVSYIDSKTKVALVEVKGIEFVVIKTANSISVKNLYKPQQASTELIEDRVNS